MSKTFKRILSVMVAAVMVLSLAMPAFADDPEPTIEEPPYQITIKGNSNTSYEKETRYAAYQIFDGTVNKTVKDDNFDGYDQGNTTNGNKPPMANQLADVTWGSGINANKIDGLLGALIGSGATLKKLGISEEIIETLAGDKTYAHLFEDVVEIQEKEIDGDYTAEKKAQELSAAIAEALKEVTLGDLFDVALSADFAKKIADAIEANELDEGDTFVDLLGVADDEYALTADELKATGATIARVIADLNVGNNSALARAFAAIVAAKGSSGYLYLSNPEAESTWVDSNDKRKGWIIGDGDSTLEGGYYLIVDTDAPTNANAKSDHILAVFGNQTIEVKSDVPTSDKDIMNSNSGNTKGADFEIGETIEFRLTGTLPENYSAYSKYYYAFHDTMSTGLTYGGYDSVKVTVAVKNPLYKETDAEKSYEKVEYINIDITGLKVDTSVTPIPTDGTEVKSFYVTYTSGKLDIVFPDLKGIDLNRFFSQVDGQLGEDYESEITHEDLVISSTSKVYVDYTAELNANANSASLLGDTNEVKLEYSSDPTWDSNGEEPEPTHNETPKKTNHVYDFGIQILKYDGSKTGEPSSNRLAGAGFALKSTVIEYAYYDNATDTDPAGWVSAEKLAAYLDEDLSTYEDWDDELTGLTGAAAFLNGKYLSANGAGEPTTKGPGKAYALFSKNGSNYIFDQWFSEEDLLKYLKKDTIADIDWEALPADGTLGAKAADSTFGDDTAYKNLYIYTLTTANGDLPIKGLDTDNTYYLEEVVTPEGYDTIDDIEIQFVAEYYGAGVSGHEEGTLKTLYYNLDGTKKDIVVDGAYVSGGNEDLYAHLSVPNYPAGYLPGTGGIGTTIFRVAGILVLLCAAALFFLNSRKKSGVQAK